MNSQRRNHWKRRTIRQIIGLGTVSSLFAGTLLANPPELPGLPGTGPSTSGAEARPQLLPIPRLLPGGSLRLGQSVMNAPQDSSVSPQMGTGNSAVNIKILPGLPASTAPATTFAGAGASMQEASERGTVQVKMQDSGASRGMLPSSEPFSTSYVTSSVAVTATAPMTIENEKANVGGPVKLSIGDSGIVDLGVQRPRQDTVVTSRAPELVKPKKYSVSQPVVLAQAADFQPTDSVSPEAQSPSVNPSTTPTEPSEIGPAVTDSSVPVAEQEIAPTEQLLPVAIRPDVLPEENSSSGATGAVIPVKPAPTSLPPTPAQSSANPRDTQADAALRQHVLRSKPEKTYDIESRGTYAIDTPFLVASTTSLDPNICTVFNHGNSITIAGGATGNTRIAVSSKTGETRIIEVNVMPIGQQFSRPQSEIDQVKELIEQVFPDARVQIVSLPTGEVEVKGTTPNESDARKILELVRKVCLVPVHDRLKAVR